MISKDDEWVSLCELTEAGDIQFTKEFLAATQVLGGGARKFASHLIAHWTSDLSGLLDYFGPDDAEKDLYTGIDGEPMDVVELLPEMWEYADIPFAGLSSEWYRDVLRAKLVSLRLPKKLIEVYVKTALKDME